MHLQHLGNLLLLEAVTELVVGLVAEFVFEMAAGLVLERL